MKALARDLPDRYQSAKELADDLNAFMSQYRFQPTEMQEFVRGLFRADYGKEASEIEACRRASIDREPEEISIESGAIQLDSTQPIGDARCRCRRRVPSSPVADRPVTSTRDTGASRRRREKSAADGRAVVAPARQVHEVASRAYWRTRMQRSSTKKKSFIGKISDALQASLRLLQSCLACVW